ncbi:hypothetical protein E0N35_07530 [Escherichia coli]|nr:hypothetical protein [Escherichia coli]EFE6892599.1 hypothetical protein [Escherichia coli]EFN3925494.1 hypothetical protein [Escherichia coli]
MIGSMPSRDRFRCHFAPSEFEPATVVPDKDLDKYDEYLPESLLAKWICPYISRHLLSLNPLLARCRRYSRGER